MQYFVTKQRQKHPDHHLVATEKSNRVMSRSMLTKFDRLSRRSIKINSNEFVDSNESNRRETSYDMCRSWALEYDYSDDDIEHKC